MKQKVIPFEGSIPLLLDLNPAKMFRSMTIGDFSVTTTTQRLNLIHSYNDWNPNKVKHKIRPPINRAWFEIAEVQRVSTAAVANVIRTLRGSLSQVGLPADLLDTASVIILKVLNFMIKGFAFGFEKFHKLVESFAEKQLFPEDLGFREEGIEITIDLTGSVTANFGNHINMISF